MPKGHDPRERATRAQTSRGLPSRHVIRPHLFAALSGEACSPNDFVGVRACGGVLFTGGLSLGAWVFVPVHDDVPVDQWQGPVGSEATIPNRYGRARSIATSAGQSSSQSA